MVREYQFARWRIYSDTHGDIIHSPVDTSRLTLHSTHRPDLNAIYLAFRVLQTITVDGVDYEIPGLMIAKQDLDNFNTSADYHAFTYLVAFEDNTEYDNDLGGRIGVYYDGLNEPEEEIIWLGVSQIYDSSGGRR